MISYVLVTGASGLLTFDSEHIENPYEPSLRARTEIHLTSPLIETLELSTNDGSSVVRVTVNLHRPADRT